MLDFNRPPIIRLPGVIFPGEVGYKMCSKTLMDTTTGVINFNADNVSNFVREFDLVASSTIWRPSDEIERELHLKIEEIKIKGKGKKYDCILGLSGGVDSSYLAHLCYTYKIKPLCVHFDYGWNTEQAVNNINKIITKTGFDLYTYVIDWEKFRELQKAYFKAGILDLDVPADHLIFGALYRVAAQNKIYTILNGNNIANEFILPTDWRNNKADYVNMAAVNKKFGTSSLSNMPTLSLERRYYYELNFNLFQVSLLNLLPYSKTKAMSILKKEYDWEYYGGKHFETVFTRWYQGCYLPLLYGIDKRKAHLSNLILNKEISRLDALEELEGNSPYPRSLQIEDCNYIAKKWGYSIDEFYYLFYNINKLNVDSFPKETDKYYAFIHMLKKIPIKAISIIR